MRPVNKTAALERAVEQRRRALPLWVGLAALALALAVPLRGWGQPNALSQAAQPAGVPIRLSALHPEQMQELKSRPLCVYNFTSW